MKIKITFTLVLVASIKLFAQVEFSENLVIDNTNLMRGVKSIMLVDIDDDGDDDLLAAATYDEKISWFENLDGLGNYGDQRIIDSNLGDVKSIYASDIDNDGDLDVVYATLNRSEIGWFNNMDSNGNFGPKQIISSIPNGYESIIAADIDGDGDMDIIAAGRFEDNVTWYENLDGHGNFGNQNIITTLTNGALSVVASDIDNDGDIDILSASSGDNKIAWYENIDGMGNFSNQQVISDDADGAQKVFTIDMDNDNDIDVLSASISDSKIAWYENLDGQGNFGSQQIISSNLGGASDVFASDIDNDGDIDVIGAGIINDSVIWYEHQIINNEINFDTFHEIATNVDGVRAIYATDINGDGAVDIVTASELKNYVDWYENIDGEGNFDLQSFISVGLYLPMSLVPVDIDGDSDIDIASANRLDDRIMWFEKIDGVDRYIPHFVATGIVEAAVVTTADIDNDGDMDLASGSINGGDIYWYENIDGNGVFEKHLILEDGSAQALSFVDLDNDNDLDLVSHFGHELLWFENMDGLGEFSNKIIIAIEIAPKTIFTVDIDNDNDMDIVSGSTVNNKLLWFENINNASSFLQHTVLPILDSESVFVVDIDGDNDEDIIAAIHSGNNNSKIVWFENLNGMGEFGPQIIISTAVDTPTRVFASDLDLDGDQDIISSSVNDRKIAWYENNGSGGFNSQRIISINTEIPRDIFSIDLDLDNDLDILSIFSHDGKIVWYENLLNLSITENESTRFLVYPNPTTQEFKIKSEFEINKIEVFDILGKLIIEKLEVYSIDLSKQSPGLYLVKIFDKNGSSEIIKIIKE